MDSGMDWHWARAALDWQIELGADEAIGETPVDRFAHEVEAQAARTPLLASTALSGAVSVRSLTAQCLSP